MRYHQSFPEVRANNGGSPTSPYEEQQQRSFHVGSPTQGYGGHPSSYHGHGSATSYSTDGGGGSYGNGHGYGSSHSDHYHGSPPQQVYCPCRTSTATGVAYLTLSQQLQNSLTSLRQYTHHSQCHLFRKIVELNDLMQYVFLVLLYTLANIPLSQAMVQISMTRRPQVIPVLQARINRMTVTRLLTTSSSRHYPHPADTPPSIRELDRQVSLHKNGTTSLLLAIIHISLYRPTPTTTLYIAMSCHERRYEA